MHHTFGHTCQGIHDHREYKVMIVDALWGRLDGLNILSKRSVREDAHGDEERSLELFESRGNCLMLQEGEVTTEI